MVGLQRIRQQRLLVAQDVKSRGIFFDFENQAEEELLSFQEVLVCGVKGMQRTVWKLGEVNKVLIVLIKRFSQVLSNSRGCLFTNRRSQAWGWGCRLAKALLPRLFVC